jgi:glycosyltransferase involved in cell wall biosynthesis
VKISVITVCFNAARSIGSTLKSVAGQTYSDVEHIVIDGSSTDETIQIIRRYSESLAIVVSEPDRGIYDAMNKGLESASGDIVCFLNADDQYAHPQVLSRVAAQIRELNLEVLAGDAAFFRSQDKNRLIRRYRSDRFKPSRLAWGWMPAHPALFLSRVVVERVGLFKTNYRIAGDFEYILRVFHGHNLRYQHLPEVLVHMQMGGISTSGLRSTCLLNQEIIRACRENNLQTSVLRLLSRYPVKLLEFIQR